ncbi:3-dehydro-L-gulonate 2-dehydrogenase [Rhodoferax fermentans]|uniref:3-dehydro-L-gulonate 2-dehydrogenase n=1 Tax=Rhodoferax fermentans TaxID=28066 RepID=A0A1T1AQ42_RHOFE|nr:3-dehydro-L-gulonate 2-dehydrogenase [Rhodoferax fermentans]MBK1683468.1 3-dehydro-L-gulonate 2-dehydrogenase [Rhodoferax fermentans]OOV06222.1 3-dehydro-L-gulonate 2-dehydrogenase [Rhodoferax fermentans]
MPRISFEDLKAQFKRVLMKKGCDEATADLSAQLMTESSCDGVYSHGVNRFPRVVEYIDKGYINLKAKPTKVDGMGAFERWNGNLGLGNVNAKLAMDRAIELARSNGIGCVAMANTNHWLRGGSYGWQAADAGCIGICWTNTQPNMPAWGARDRRIGNNPFIMAVPRQGGHVVVDVAMAQFSYGQMENKALRNEMLPVPGGFDEQGQLSCDPNEILKSWRVLPIGYWKGSALSIVLDLVATVLSGGRSVASVGQLSNDEYGLSQMFIALDANNIAGEDYLKSAVEEVLENLHASERVDPNQSVLYPGENSLAIRNTNLANGIPVDDGVWAKIQAL